MALEVPELAFFRPPERSPELAILRAARELPRRSSGEITGALLTEDNAGTPDPWGPLSERVFGPRHDFRCACGKLAGPAHTGERCPICQVECISSDVRAVRYGHIAAAGGLVHRRLGGLVARCLEWTEEEVWQVAFFQSWVEDGEVSPLMPGGDPRMELSGPEMLRELLSSVEAGARWPVELAEAGFAPRDLVLDVVPVTPPEMRRPHRRPGGALMPGLDSVRYQELLVSNRRLRARRDAGREDVYTYFEHLTLQTAFDALCVQLGSPPDDSREQPSMRPVWSFSLDTRYWLKEDGWAVELTAPPPVDRDAAEVRGTRTRPTGCAFLGPDAVLLCFPFTALVVGLEDGHVRATHSLEPATLVSVAPGGEHAVFSADGELHAFDLVRGGWTPDAPGMPLAAVAERAGRTYLVDARRDVTAELVEVQGPLWRWAASPDGRLLWAEDASGRGGVYAVDTGLRQVDRGGWRFDATSAPELDVDGTLRPAPAPEEGGSREERLAGLHGARTDSAFALGVDGRWRFLDLGLLVIDGAPVCRLAFQGSAGAFDTTGERLLVVNEEEAVVLEVEPVPRILRRLPLRLERLADFQKK